MSEGDQNPLNGIRKVVEAMSRGGECEVCGAEDGYEVRELKPLNPLGGEITHVWLCESCWEDARRQNHVSEQIRESIEMFVDGMAHHYLSDVEGLPFLGEPAIEDVTDIDGVGEVKAEKLAQGGFDSISDLHEASVNQLTEHGGISTTLAWDIKHTLMESAKANLMNDAAIDAMKNND